MVKLAELLSSIVTRWRNGEAADAQAVIAEHPELRNRKSVVLDLAYAEYRQRTAAGEELDIDEYCAQYSAFQYSLRRTIEVDEFWGENSSLMDGGADSNWPQVGDQFDVYRLQEELGRGAIGRVFLAEEDGLVSRRVVVKISPSGQDEAQTLVRLQHPHVVTVYDVKRDDDWELFGVVMPFLGRTTLGDFLDAAFTRGEPPPRFVDVLRHLHALYPREELAADVEVDLAKLAGLSYVNGVAALGRDLAEALAHTHQRNILHLDLKPSNVLVSPHGKTLLLDFNLSADRGERSGLLGGTLPYMSPEQIRAAVFKNSSAAASVDGRSDVFSLGVILYELLSGQHPFALDDWKRGAGEIGEQLLDAQSRGAPLVSSFRENVDGQLARIVARCLESIPEKRFQSAEDLAAELEKCLTSPRRLQRAVHVHRREFAAAGVLAAACLTGCMTYVAMLPSRFEVLMAEGLRSYEAQDYDRAIDAFQEATKIEPGSAEAWFRLGRSLLWTKKTNGILDAKNAFLTAHDLEQEARFSACAAYCITFLDKQLNDSLFYYEQAKKEGFDTAEFHNCYGYCLANMFGATEKHLADAEYHLKLAIEKNPELIAARYNLLRLHLGINGPSRVRDDHDAEFALQNADTLAEIADRTNNQAIMIYYHCATAWLEFGGSKPSQNDKILKYLTQAVECGYKPELIQSGNRFSHLKSERRYQELVNINVNHKPPTIQRFTDPLGEEWRRLTVGESN